MNFGEKLKTTRKEHGYSQEALAELLGISRQAVCKWENSQGYPEIDTLVSISQILGVSVDYLLKEEECKNETSGFYVSSEMLDGFLNFKYGFAKRITIGVCLMFMSSVFFVKGSVISEILESLCMLVGIAILILQLVVPNHYKTLYNQELLFNGTTISSFKKKYYHNRRLYACAFIAGFGLLFFSEIFVRICIGENVDKVIIMNIETFMDVLAIGIFLLCGLLFKTDRFIMNKMEEGSRTSNTWLYAALPITVIAVIIGFFSNAWSPIMPMIFFGCILLYKLYKEKGERK